jgi:hypothetical protein
MKMNFHHLNEEKYVICEINHFIIRRKSIKFEMISVSQICRFKAIASPIIISERESEFDILAFFIEASFFYENFDVNELASA